jgi:hypothetical protein
MKEKKQLLKFHPKSLYPARNLLIITFTSSHLFSERGVAVLPQSQLVVAVAFC